MLRKTVLNQQIALTVLPWVSPKPEPKTKFILGSDPKDLEQGWGKGMEWTRWVK